MTAEAGVHAEVSTKVEVEEEAHGLDLSNGTNVTANQDADASYVFVTGKDAADHDPLHPDLKPNGNGISELEMVSGDHVDDGETHHVPPTPALRDRNGQPPVSASEDRHPDDDGIISENGESSIPGDRARNVLVVEESREPEIGVSDGGNQEPQVQLKSDLGLGLEQNKESQIGVEEAVQIIPDQGKQLTPDHRVGRPSGDHLDDFEHISKMADAHSSAKGDNAQDSPPPAQSDDNSTAVEVASGNTASELAAEIQIQLRDEIVNAFVPDQSVEVLPDSHAQDQEDPEAIVVVDANQNSPEQGNFPATAVDEVRTESGVGKSQVNVGERADSHSVDSLGVANEVAENFAIDEVGTEAEVDNSEEVANEVVENSGIDEVRIEAEVGNSEENILESADSQPVGGSEAANEVAENAPASALNEVSIEPEVDKSGENSRESPDYHLVDASEVTIEVTESTPVRASNEASTAPEVEKEVAENSSASDVDEARIEPEVEKSEEKSSEIVVVGSHPIDNSERETEVTESSAVEIRTEAEVLKAEEESKGNVDSHSNDNSKVATQVSENLPSSAVDEVKVRTEAEVGKSEEIICADADNSELNTGAVNDRDTTPSCLANGGISETKTGSDSVVPLEVVSSLPSTDVGIDPEVDIGAKKVSTESIRNMPSNDSVATEPGKWNDTPNDSEKNCTHDDDKLANIVIGGIQLSSIDHDKLYPESEAVNVVHKDESPTGSREGSTIDTSEAQNPIPEGGKRRFYLVKVPRYDDENLREQIRQAQLRVDERTKSRDAIRADIQKKRATCKELSDDFEAAVSQERAARELLRSKRQEIDSLQSVISIEDIDGRIRNMEHMIQHETLPLKEEKQLIREIKQLKQVRENLSSTMGRQDGAQQTSEQKDQIEGRLKSLKKEADILRDNVLKAEVITKAAKKKCSEENESLSKLLSEFKSADAIRQEAYAHLQSLRKQSYEKNKYFWQCRDDAKAAYDLAFEKDIAALEHHCSSQVEKNMDLFVKNDEYRKDYLRCNIRSTLRRLRTLDGRSLGPDEEPPVIPHVANERVVKDNTLSISTPEEEIRGQVVPAEPEKAKDKLVMKTAEEKNLAAKPKKSTKSIPPPNNLAIASARDEIDEATEEEQKKRKEEEELTRRAEELRKKEEEEEEAKLMEQQRLEEKAKAKEALERKKRIAEKAQARAVLRAQKEAEEKEKEREKRARKKERRKAAAAAGAGEDTSVTNEVESEPASETPTQTPNEVETREKQVTTTKKPQKQSQYTKQSKAKSIPPPPPLRNRGKRRMQPWMWVLLLSLVVVALFLVGNSNFSFNFGLHR